MGAREENFALESRVLFIDTCIYHAGNFQFFKSEFASVSKLLQEDKLTLLVTSATISEVKRHLEEGAKSAASGMQSLRQKAKILRNLPSYSKSLIFEDFHVESIAKELIGHFERFLSTKNLKIVSLELASAEKVFEKYFSKSPPFSQKKPDEFRDAFVLESLKAYAVEEGLRIHVISDDDDMRAFCESEPLLVWSNNLREYVDAALHLERVEPAAFADQALSVLEKEVGVHVENYLVEQEFGMTSEYGTDRRVERCDISSLAEVARRLVDLGRNYSRYVVEYEFVVKCQYLQSDFVGGSSEAPVMIQIDRFIASYRKYIEVEICLDYFEGDLSTVSLEDWSFNLPSGDILWDDEVVQGSVQNIS